MTLPVYSTRFLVEHDLTSYVSFTCPSGYTGVVAHADAYFGAPGTSAQCLLLWNAPGLNLVVIKAFTPPTSAQPYDEHWEGRFVFYPGESIWLQAISATVDCSCAGYLLAGEPPVIVMPQVSSSDQISI
jgi:hypothetical protein